jgi:hypothetical protein
VAGKEIVPALGLDRFTCPYPDCGAIAHQTWFKARVEGYDDDGKPWLMTQAEAEKFKRDPQLKSMVTFIEKMLAKKIFFEIESEGAWRRITELMNIHVSRCFSCSGVAIWHGDELIYPVNKIAVAPDEGMPDDVKTVFLEANEIIDKSPKGAAALLRLCVQKLMPHLGEKGENINADIASLVSKGLDTRIQKALDVVRVVGNNAVHPGQIDLDDDKTIAANLFGLVNLIVETQITQKRHIDQLFDAVVPDRVKVQIEKRDAPKQIAPPKDNST